MRRLNLSTLVVVVGIFLIGALGCGSAARKERDQQRQQTRERKERISHLIKTLEPKTDEWAKLSPPDRLMRAPYVKGKLAVVYRRAEGVNELLENDVAGLGDLYAQTPAEVQTVVQTDCFQVRRGTYITKDEEQKEIPAYVSECEIAMVDLSLPAIVYRKKFENAKLADEISSANVFWEEIKRKNKVVAPEPQVEIRSFLLSLPRK